MAKGKPKRLRRIQLAEISTCGVPSNQHSRITISKGKELVKASYTSRVEGHKHQVFITGGIAGLNVMLEESDEGRGGMHTHPVVRTRGGWTVGVVAGHTHALPNLRRVIEGLLETDPLNDDGEGTEKGGKLLTKATDGHAHFLALDSEGAPVVLASGKDGHTHVIEKGRGGSYQVLRGPDGHTHGLPDGDFTKHLRRDGGTAPAPTGDGGPATMTKANNPLQKAEREISDLRKAAEAAEEQIDRLAKECAAELGITHAQGVRAVLQTDEGRALYRAMTHPDLSKSAREIAFDLECEQAIEKLLKDEVGRWDSSKVVDEKRASVTKAFFDSDQFREIYRKHFSESELDKQEESPMRVVEMGLVTQQQVERDPEMALDLVAHKVSMQQGISVAQAVREITRRDGVARDLYLLADAAHRERSLAAQANS